LHGSCAKYALLSTVFMIDWVTGKISKTNANVSEDGYPRTLQILVDGVEAAMRREKSAVICAGFLAIPLQNRINPH